MEASEERHVNWVFYDSRNSSQVKRSTSPGREDLEASEGCHVDWVHAKIMNRADKVKNREGKSLIEQTLATPEGKQATKDLKFTLDAHKDRGPTLRNEMKAMMADFMAKQENSDFQVVSDASTERTPPSSSDMDRDSGSNTLPAHLRAPCIDVSIKRTPEEKAKIRAQFSRETFNTAEASEFDYTPMDEYNAMETMILMPSPPKKPEPPRMPPLSFALYYKVKEKHWTLPGPTEKPWTSAEHEKRVSPAALERESRSRAPGEAPNWAYERFRGEHRPQMGADGIDKNSLPPVDPASTAPSDDPSDGSPGSRRGKRKRTPTQRAAEQQEQERVEAGPSRAAPRPRTITSTPSSEEATEAGLSPAGPESTPSSSPPSGGSPTTGLSGRATRAMGRAAARDKRTAGPSPPKQSPSPE